MYINKSARVQTARHIMWLWRHSCHSHTHRDKTSSRDAEQTDAVSYRRNVCVNTAQQQKNCGALAAVVAAAALWQSASSRVECGTQVTTHICRCVATMMCISSVERRCLRPLPPQQHTAATQHTHTQHATSQRQRRHMWMLDAVWAAGRLICVFAVHRVHDVISHWMVWLDVLVDVCTWRAPAHWHYSDWFANTHNTQCTMYALIRLDLPDGSTRLKPLVRARSSFNV